MRSDLFGLFRAFLFTFLIIAFCCLCVVEVDTHSPVKIHEVPETEPQETAPALLNCAAELKTLEDTHVHVIEKTPTERSVEAHAPIDQPEPSEQVTPQIEITEPEPSEEPEPQWISYGTYTLTAYCACETCCGYWATTRPLDENGNPIVYTASGARAEAGTTIAVDPSISPYGTQVKINDHIYTAQDTGGAIKGNRIDIFFDNHADAWNFGMQQAEVFIMQED